MNMVSCLCVSRPSRWAQLQRAITDFSCQTYENRELIVALDSTKTFVSTVNAFVLQHLSEKMAKKVHVIGRPIRSQLEGLTQAAIHADGDILTLWDDDNLNHPLRLEVQIGQQEQFPRAITAFSEGVYIFWKDREMFVVHMDQVDDIASRVLPSSIMAFRKHFPVMEFNTHSRPSELMLRNAARDSKSIVSIPGQPFLHFVGVTYDNLRGYQAHRRIAQEFCRPVGWLHKHEHALRIYFSEMPWDADTEFQVEGPDAGAFKLVPELTSDASFRPIVTDAPESDKKSITAKGGGQPAE